MSRRSSVGSVRGGSFVSRRGDRLTAGVAAIFSAILVCLSSQSAVAALSFSGDVSFNTGIPNSQVQVGRESVGSLRLDNGTVFNSGPVQIGVGQSGIGFATVNGSPTLWNMSSADVGVNGVGRFGIQDGAVVNVTGGFRIGANSTGNGTVTVDGPGSTLLVRGLLGLGSPGRGLLQISNGAIVNATQVQTRIYAPGRVLLDGGLLRLSAVINDGLISGSGELDLLTAGSNLISGRLEVGEGDHLRITSSGFTSSGLFSNQGRITVDGGELEMSGSLDNSKSGLADGEIILRNGIIRVGGKPGDLAQLRNGGLLAAIGGENHVHGTVQNTFRGQLNIPEIAITNQSVMIFHDDVSLQSGMMTVFPGSKATLLENLSLASGSMLLADIAGSDIDTDYGEIEVVGNVQLGGAQLQVTLTNGFMPKAGDSFQIVKALGGIDGSLTLGAMPLLPGALVWDLGVTANQVMLNVVPAPTGDYNRDGVVDAADYIVWRKAFGQSGAGLPADGNGDGVVNEADHAVWRSNFGRTAGGPAGASIAAVPEPTGLTILLLGVIAILGRVRSRFTCLGRSYRR